MPPPPPPPPLPPVHEQPRRRRGWTAGAAPPPGPPFAPGSATLQSFNNHHREGTARPCHAVPAWPFRGRRSNLPA